MAGNNATEMRDALVEQFREAHVLHTGRTMFVECAEAYVLAEYDDKEVFGCGERLLEFVVWDEPDVIWEMVADMFLLHLHNDHGLDIEI